jgi:hypothetical protein
VALFPTPFVLLYLPGIDDVAYKVECITGIVFKEIVEFIRLTVFGTEVYIADKD